MASLQEEDIQKLDESRTLSLLEECKETINRLNREITAQRRQRSLLEERIIALRSPTSPLHRMPDELMLDIFEKVKRDDLLALRGILRVCRKWYQLAVNSPFLWAYIKLDFEYVSDAAVIKRGQQYVEAAICYSKQAPLSVDISLPTRYALVNQTSLNILGIEIWDLDDDNENEDRHDKVFEWMDEALSSDPHAFLLYKDNADAISKLMAAVAGSNGVNLIRLRSFNLHYDPDQFNGWLLDGVFHHPTPILKELRITVQDIVSSGLALDPIFPYQAPSLSRISVQASYPLDNLLDSNSAINSLYLDFDSVTLDAFPNHASLRNLKYLFIESLYSEQISINANLDILLPFLEDLTFRGTYVPKFIKAPRLTTLRILVYRNIDFDPAHMPYYPSLKRLHWRCGEENFTCEPLQEYLDRHPFVEEIAVVHTNDILVKNRINQLKDALGDGKLAIKGYQGRGQLWSWSAPFPYESNEIDTN